MMRSAIGTASARDGQVKTEDRKAAVAAYKERKVEGGIYTVRCAASGEVWVGSAPDLSTIQARLWFTLRQGVNPHRSLQQAWAAHGSETFSFEIVDRLAEEDRCAGQASRLRTLLARWKETLQAVRI